MTDDDSTVLDCGKTIDELSDYLDRGREPWDASIETCPVCLNALDALARVARLSRDLIDDDATQLPPPPEGWLKSIMDSVHAELRAGRELPLRHPDPRVRITVTEGAVRSLLRATGDAIDGLFIGRTEIIGDAEIAGAPIEIRLTATVGWGTSIPEVADTLRAHIFSVLEEHTELNVISVDVTVEDIHGYDHTKDRA
ncbi:Asp23/Gls24 family envelope stress response protein [Microbacterium sp. P01]|uniref:Asp23/Gls24 family envelope stress response protein n=1 Tax=unclassified Microbacterium TaxID=2609290 RepID=UPI00366AADE6